MPGIKPLHDCKIYPTLNPSKKIVPKNVSAVLKATALSTRDASKLFFFENRDRDRDRIEIVTF